MAASDPDLNSEFPLKGLWLYDLHLKDVVTAYRMGSHVAHVRTKGRDVRIEDIPGLGRCLFIDGKLHYAQADGQCYYELFVQPAMTAHPAPRTVFIYGGATGGVLKEVVRWRTVESVVLSHVDSGLLALCRDYLATCHRGAFDDPRVRIDEGGADEFGATTDQRFDVVVGDFDLLDETTGTVSSVILAPIRAAVARLLNADGVVVTQVGGVSDNKTDRFDAIVQTLGGILSQVRAYVDYLPSRRSLEAFVMASSRPYWNELDATEVDNRLRGRGLDLQFYDGETHRRITSLPKLFRTRLAGMGRDRPDEPSGAMA